jgi:acetyl-CoA acetyltransferase
MREASIIGVGMTPFGRHLDKSHSDLARLAVLEALDDAGITADQLGMAIYANVIQGFFAGEMSIPGEYALRPLGVQGVKVLNVEAACASSTIGLHTACAYIRAGLADVVLIVGVE